MPLSGQLVRATGSLRLRGHVESCLVTIVAADFFFVLAACYLAWPAAGSDPARHAPWHSGWQGPRLHWRAGGALMPRRVGTGHQSRSGAMPSRAGLDVVNSTTLV